MTAQHSPRGRAAARAIGAGVVTTSLVAFLSYAVPASHSATVVGLGFLAATYVLVLRSPDPDAAKRFGLSLGGLLDPEPLDAARIVRSAAAALGAAIGLGLIVFPAFWVGYVLWWSPLPPFRPAPLAPLVQEAFGQFLVIALPEEAFYRGYLQTSLDSAWPPRLSILGARIGAGALVTSALFALGHLATEFQPSRLAVFFPSLLFGWLRTRRGSVGTSAAFHMLCNLFASYLGRSYGLFA